MRCPEKSRDAANASAARSLATDTPSIVLITIDTLRPDHMSAYGYRRDTTPHLADWAKRGAVFEQAYTYWPKTRGSFVAMMSGKTAGESGYSSRFPELHAFNTTLAETLKKAGYATAAFVDNPNVGEAHGFARGFDTYVETWKYKTHADTEVARTEAITRGALSFLLAKRVPQEPFFLWLHYVNPHAPYAPPAPFDALFSDRPKNDPLLKITSDPFGGLWKQWAIPGKNRLSDYVNAYDGEIAYVDSQVDGVFKALDAQGLFSKSTILLTSDHGESFGENNYYFDHGANLYDACQRVPMIVWNPEAQAGSRSSVLVSTLDVMPTLLDVARVSYPSGLAGRSMLPFAAGRVASTREQLFGENDRGWSGAWDERHKVVRVPISDGRGKGTSAPRSTERMLDRLQDPREERVAPGSPQATRLAKALDAYVDAADRSAARTRAQLQGQSMKRLPKEECDRLRALGYLGVVGCD